MTEDETIFRLLRADPHEHGGGKIHLFDQEKDKTFCGLSPQRCPGVFWNAPLTKVTCKGCRAVRIARIEREARQAEWQKKQELLQVEQSLHSQEWWQAYERYLQSSDWLALRLRVLQRAKNICEGCLNAKAIHVHHKRYPLGALPGTEEWLRQQKAFDLVALCLACHQDLHPQLDAREQ